MIFGDRSKFAVQFQLDQNYGGEWLFGKFCYWINGQQVGDYNLGTSLRDVLFLLVSIVRDNGQRKSTELYALDKDEFYSRLNTALYGTEPSPYSNNALEETWARFNVTLHVDVFDSCKVFLVEKEDNARFVFKKSEEGHIHEAKCEPGEFDAVIHKTYTELNKLYESEFRKD
jgi:hypothetical protein